MSALKKNHEKDFMHRVEESVTIIKFSTIRDLVYLNYKEVMVVNVQTWFANPMHKSYSTLTEKHNRIVSRGNTIIPNIEKRIMKEKNCNFI